MDYQEYRKDFLTSLRNDSAINGTDTEDEFISRALELLTDFNEIDDPQRIGMGDKKGRGNRIMRADGYSFDKTDNSLIVFISDFQDTLETSKLTISRVDELYWRLYYFLDEACNGKMDDYFDDSDDILKVARLIRKKMNALADDPELILKIKFFILTNKELDTMLQKTNLLESVSPSKGAKASRKKRVTKSTKKIKKADFNNKPLEINIWYPERFFELESSNANEPVIIDFEEDNAFGEYRGIPCIKGDIGSDLGYEAYIAIIPGKLLAQIYIEYGSRVLEGNVRAFLGTSARGKKESVNNGIKKTINTDPTKFFTYNNGIATTAAGVETAFIDGELMITRIEDLQIINGGQTTATLAEAVLKKTNPALEGIFVPMKLTVIEDRETENEDGISFYDQMVKNIARYANSQNKVTSADFFSNDPFHVWMEKKSKKILADPVFSPIPTGWYYERSRKRYEQEQTKLRGDELKRFQNKFPKKQVITKEQLAMYLTTLNCKPHIVSKGKDFVMREFGTEIGNAYREDRNQFNDLFFKKCICSAIIFRTVDYYLESHKDSAKKPTGFWYKAGGYKLNIVPYTIAKIISSIPEGYSLNYEQIWKKQAVSPAFMREIELVTKRTNDFICNSGGVIVTEYCKRQATWEAYLAEEEYAPSKAFLDELIPSAFAKEAEKSEKAAEKEINDLDYAMQAVQRGFDYWKTVLDMGNARNLLSFQEQSNLKKMMEMAASFNIPTTGTGKIPRPVMNILKSVNEIVSKLQSEGIIINS